LKNSRSHLLATLLLRWRVFFKRYAKLTASAILDRFLHHAEIINITGKSYRLQNRQTTTAGDEEKTAKQKSTQDACKETAA